LIDIPFQERWRDAMLTGRKTCTTRTKRYGQVGDTFIVFGETFVILGIDRTTLEIVAQRLWQEEGCSSRKEFIEVWNGLHPRRGYRVDDRVWVHYFLPLQLLEKYKPDAGVIGDEQETSTSYS
jgi:hypothetical protein